MAELSVSDLPPRTATSGQRGNSPLFTSTWLI